ncbi:glycosyltransferase involved in cell wall biosynthesis [Leeuwenhoekiella aestuarii]|uniref:Glycosyltransferase involved in cell wall biosynthesis n=1 Tax=Leeuwenhoekiella aestuarii TaxID=2249426 RepID=A0A4Q0NV52_9FLAO|nr:glycosyltransferase family 4 protein [Leeuwenhoekiella aestuarii]RXG11653.1 glycosyltransferase involved in cell wall biosynthesis [Leeuwenhoekiella aestuarii]RXG15136.1 glycosyltransferase involved in cell wall biosynthesis [Leeuwenhoekiella aestuarii]
MKIAILAPIAWRTPPETYGPWEQVASTITEGLVARGHEVSLFATGNSVTAGTLEAVCAQPYEEDREADPKVSECLHITNLMERAGEFDIIHNHFDFLPLTYSRLIKTPMITTIHGFSSPKILPVYQKYDETTAYISISNADRHDSLNYLNTIYHGVDPALFTLRSKKEEYLLYFGRIHPEKGLDKAIAIARHAKLQLKIAGLIQDEQYYQSQIQSQINGDTIQYLGNLCKKERDVVLGGAKALLHPISFEEPFGLSVLEAMMCGTPVIAFSRGSMPELIVEGVSGFLVKTIAEAVAAIKKLNNLNPKKIRAHAETNFSMHKMITAYEAAYVKVIKS